MYKFVFVWSNRRLCSNWTIVHIKGAARRWLWESRSLTFIFLCLRDSISFLIIHCWLVFVFKFILKKRKYIFAKKERQKWHSQELLINARLVTRLFTLLICYQLMEQLSTNLVSNAAIAKALLWYALFLLFYVMSCHMMIC